MAYTAGDTILDDEYNTFQQFHETLPIQPIAGTGSALRIRQPQQPYPEPTTITAAH